ncbi:hypothetical protein JQ633_08915 [Bradyrhizobium tropiciagri]|uniref:hypothetical protein n=1 Tax=Bradyrhizobium tropiciagri TaxID=312253 RepID=UPI001BA9604F|nr:hypothetical protein [Bradyrhizobium tropiciagri]MBR0870477.1 hypothetical protein [Bradyrhizobium tropiciagri]
MNIREIATGYENAVTRGNDHILESVWITIAMLTASRDYLIISVIIGAAGLFGPSILSSIAPLHPTWWGARDAAFLLSPVVLLGWLAFLGCGLYDEGVGVLRLFIPCLPMIPIGALVRLAYACSCAPCIA